MTSLTLLLICLYRAAKAQGLPVVQTLAPLIFSDNLGQPKFNLDIPERPPFVPKPARAPAASWSARHTAFGAVITC